MNSAFFFFGGMADIFLSLILWFILDSEKTAAFYMDGERVYAVRNVIKTNIPSLNDDCVYEEEQEELDGRLSTYVSSRSSSISKRMIDQFFTEVEGPDRDWSQGDYDIFNEDDDPQEPTVEK